MRKIYAVNYNLRANEHSIFESTLLQEATDFYNNELAKCTHLAKPADVSNWRDDYDRAWGTVYYLELVEITIDDDIEENYVTNIETLKYSDYYYATDL